MRGASRAGGEWVHLLAAMEHGTRAVLAQAGVAAKTNEIPAFPPLLQPLDLTDVVITCDALHTQRAHADWLVTAKHAHYLFVVKGNQPTLHAGCAALAWHNVPELDRTRGREPGRVEIRTLKAVSVRGGVFAGFPHAAQILQVTRKTRGLGTRSWRTTTAYAVTSLDHAQASPARLADLLRGHWAIENGLHWVPALGACTGCLHWVPALGAGRPPRRGRLTGRRYCDAPRLRQIRCWVRTPRSRESSAPRGTPGATVGNTSFGFCH
jgi:predicted transposase YbfD/YdcC